MLDNYWAKKCNNPNDSKSEYGDRVDNADKLREVVLSDLMEKQSPKRCCFSLYQNEVSLMW
jgi:hypothetical protein